VFVGKAAADAELAVLDERAPLALRTESEPSRVMSTIEVNAS